MVCPHVVTSAESFVMDVGSTQCIQSVEPLVGGNKVLSNIPNKYVSNSTAEIMVSLIFFGRFMI